LPKFSYTLDPAGKRPLIPVQFLRDDNTWAEIVCHLDTAADVTVLPYDFARRLKYVDVQRPLFVREVVGSLAASMTAVRARIVGKEITLPMITSNWIIDPLLGIAAFLDNFVVTLRPDGFSVDPAA
jgi:hypothetical protein